MQRANKRIQDLLDKYIKNNCTREEFEELILLAQEQGNDWIIKEVMEKDWDGRNISGRIGPKVEGGIRSVKSLTSRWMKIAASLAVLVAMGVVVYQLVIPHSVEYTTGNGEVRNFSLPDGSEVKLNANSTLTWVGSDLFHEDRSVELAGEAFFDVTKSTNRRGEFIPFKVLTNDLTVNVLGTSFNVSSRANFSEVYLYEGKVELEIGGESSKVLNPGDRIGYDHDDKKMVENNSQSMASSASWVNGVLNFHDRTFGYVLRNLSDIYGKEFTCNDTSLMKRKINLGVPYMDWENTKNALEMSMGVKFIKEDGGYTVARQ